MMVLLIKTTRILQYPFSRLLLQIIGHFCCQLNCQIPPVKPKFQGMRMRQANFQKIEEITSYSKVTVIKVNVYLSFLNHMKIWLRFQWVFRLFQEKWSEQIPSTHAPWHIYSNSGRLNFSLNSGVVGCCRFRYCSVRCLNTKLKINI